MQMQSPGLPASTSELVELDAIAVRASVELVGRVTAADLGCATPCAAWNLHELIAHMATQHHGFAAAAGGADGPDAWQPRPLGGDPARSYREAAARVVAAFAGAGVPGRAFALPEISTRRRFPAAQAISFHLLDYVVHAWDVARALGVPVDFEPAVLAAALAVAKIVPAGQARLAPGAAFGPVVPWRAGHPLEEILALAGRSPAWPAPAA